MPETPQQYTARILANLGGRDPLEVLAATPGTLDRLLAGAPGAALARRPAPDSWSVHEILYHLADAEMVVGFRVRLALGANGTPIQAFDQDSWAAAERYAELPLPPALEAFRALRSLNVGLYRSLTPEQWEQYGMHSERGRETVRHMISMNAGHDLNHLRQVEKIVSRLGSQTAKAV